MQRRPFISRIPGAALCAALLALACSEESSGGGAGGSAGTGGSAGSDAGATIAAHGTVTGYTWSPSDAGTGGGWSLVGPVEGMQVCLRGSSAPCTTTAANGSYRLEGVPASSPVAFYFEHADWAGRNLLQRVTADADYEESPPLAATAGFNVYLAGSGCSVPPDTGTAALFIGMPPGASVTLTPTPSVAPVYFNGDAFDPAATQAGGTPEQAGAVVCGLAPGEYDLDFQGTTGTCRFAEGWPSAGHHVRAVAENGSVTVVNWICE